MSDNSNERIEVVGFPEGAVPVRYRERLDAVINEIMEDMTDEEKAACREAAGIVGPYAAEVTVELPSDPVATVTVRIEHTNLLHLKNLTTKLLGVFSG